MIQESDFGSLQEEVRQLSGRIELVEQDLKNNTAATSRVEQNTSDLVAAWSAAKGAFKVLEIIGRIGKPLLMISGLLAAIGVGWSIKK
jgi:hypothetical protein